MINCDCMIMALITYDIPFEMYKHLKVILVMMILKGHGSSCSYYESPSLFRCLLGLEFIQFRFHVQRFFLGFFETNW